MYYQIKKNPHSVGIKAFFAEHKISCGIGLKMLVPQFLTNGIVTAQYNQLIYIQSTT